MSACSRQAGRFLRSQRSVSTRQLLAAQSDAGSKCEDKQQLAIEVSNAQHAKMRRTVREIEGRPTLQDLFRPEFRVEVTEQGSLTVARPTQGRVIVATAG